MRMPEFAEMLLPGSRIICSFLPIKTFSIICINSFGDGGTSSLYGTPKPPPRSTRATLIPLLFRLSHSLRVLIAAFSKPSRLRI